MITPFFKVTQNFSHIEICIKARHVKISADSEPEFFIHENEFRFYCKPYYLRLHFSHKLAEDGNETAVYKNGYFIVKISKAVPYEDFDDLDLLTKLLTPRKVNAKAPSIEVINDKLKDLCVNDVDEKNDDEDDEDDDEEIDWHIEQQPTNTDDDYECNNNNLNKDDVQLSMVNPKYGFGHIRSNVFKTLKDELSDAIDLKHVEDVPETMRRQLRLEAEAQDFDDDHYLSDLYDCEVIQRLLEYIPPWTLNDQSMEVEFTDDEKELMMKLPQKNYILTADQKKHILLSLVDILFAYAYNVRTTEGENTVESGWTIRKLSSTLSWFDSFKNVNELFTSCMRRSLIYPLYRNYELSSLIFKDVFCILEKGKRFVLRCLIEIRKLFLESDDLYILNDLYIDDYCIWVQHIKDECLKSLILELKQVHIGKADLDLDIEIVEQAALLAVKERLPDNLFHPTTVNDEDVSDSDDDDD